MTAIRRISLRADKRGAAAIEFAIAGPVLMLFIISLLQLGIIFFAHNGMQHAVGEGARHAMLFPTPSDSAIIAEMTDSRFGLRRENIERATITRGVLTGTTADYAEIALTYNVPLSFGFIDIPDVTLTESRRAYLQ